MAVAIPVTGWAESRWGGKRVWLAALVLFVGGSVLCALAWNDASLIGFRVGQGFAAGLIFPLMQTLAVRAAGGRASSSLIAAVSLPLALGPGSRRPLVDVRLLRLRSLGSASAVLFTAGAALYAGMFLLPLYYQQLRGESVLDAGLLLIPQGVGSLAARFAVARLVARFGGRLVTIASFLVTAAATVPFALAGPRTSLWLLGAVLVIRGFGIGAVIIPPLSVAYQDVRPAGIPHATMNTRIAQQVGASFGIAIVAVALQSLLARGAVGAFEGAFWWATGISVAALIPALALPGARERRPA
jgi:MFS family permease